MSEPISPEKLREILDCHGKWLRGEVGGSRANLAGANLAGAKGISDATNLTGEPWSEYLSRVVPALLTAGGKTLAELAATNCWDCHSWENCPMAEAFGVHSANETPLLLRPRVEQFVQLFDAGLIPKSVLGGESAGA